ncbi:hypothetical protein L6452_34796 [Arctium lappa]|uniref:Uncharacterized protein n=1 Tax=Arctium lappa TaxID=4217 RepID=A0ACB8YK85_ARCLA|nr:hypothetical protein L6452_34796 [Arctium lappa]
MNLPPCKIHRRSINDISFGFSTILRSSPPLISLRGSKVMKSGPNRRPRPSFASLGQGREDQWSSTYSE